MPRLRKNDREQSVGMVQAGMTHQAIADHFNVSRNNFKANDSSSTNKYDE
jgi:DNA-binding NarL/FixJ family response regulator